MHRTLGAAALLRAFRGGRIAAVETGRVVGAGERGLLVWVGSGSAVLRRTTLDGRSIRKMSLAQRFAVPTRLSPARWTGPGVLILCRPQVAHAVWWFFTESGRFARWYVNLQRPVARWHDGDLAGVDTEDHALDAWVEPDRSWRWKDEDEFAERTGHPLFWSAAEADQIREEGLRVRRAASSGAFPFDGTWCDFRPDPAWPPSRLPAAGWDRPQAHLTDAVDDRRDADR